MKLETISNVSVKFGVSTRTLRYYEQIGLIASTKKENYAYRAYDEQSVAKIQQIVILRKLNISLKQIERIMQNGDAMEAVAVFQEKIAEIEEEVDSLNTLKQIIGILVDRLNKTADLKIANRIFDDETVSVIMNSAALTKKQLKEKKTMEDLNKASEKLSEIKDVRIVYIPPSAVASSHFVGDDPEDVAGDMLNKFIRTSGLCKIKPDLRVYGFNNPNPDEKGFHGYEFWVTVPEDFKVEEPMAKKHFEGGLYAAHCIKMGDFHEWQAFGKWIMENKDYEYDRREPLGMDGTLEEHLNAFSFYSGEQEDAKLIQLDLLIPIKKRQ